MNTLLLIAFVTTLLALLSNIVSSWVEPILTKWRKLTVLTFIALALFSVICIKDNKVELTHLKIFFSSKELSGHLDSIIDIGKNVSFTENGKIRTIDIATSKKLLYYKVFQYFNINDTVLSTDKHTLLLLVDSRWEGLKGGLSNTSILYPQFKHLENVITFDNVEKVPKDIQEATLVIIDTKNNILYKEHLGRESARVDIVYLYENLLKQTFIVTVNFESGTSRFSGPSSHFFEIQENKVKYLFNKKSFGCTGCENWLIVGYNGKKICLKESDDYVENKELIFRTNNIMYYQEGNSNWKTLNFHQPGIWENNPTQNEVPFDIFQFTRKLDSIQSNR